MDITKVKQDIVHWMETFVEKPHPALGGWPPCPYARTARLEQDYEVRIGRNPFEDLISLSYGKLEKSVIILAYDPECHDYEQFHAEVDYANHHYLLPKDLIALEDHPSDPELVNGVCMNIGTYALVLVQCASELDQKAKAMAQHGFYDTWPDQYLNKLFEHRQDPRK